MPPRISLLLKYLAKELINPITYLVAFLIGASINTLQGNGLWFSAVPYIVPLFVQSFAKASIKFKNKDMDILCQLPAERQDPVFVIDKMGRVVAVAGNTKKLFKRHHIKKLDDLFEKSEADTILKATDDMRAKWQVEPMELNSKATGKWYQVKTKIGEGGHVLIWLDEISSRKAMDISLTAIRGFSREVLNSINELAKENDIYDRLALLILKEGYRGVFITREDQDGNLAGYVFKGNNHELLKSEYIQVPEASAAPIWASRKAECDIYGCVATATRPDSMPQADFEKAHPFDERVKSFLGFAITNYINYAEGDVSIIGFNKKDGIKKFDTDVINTVVNTARSVTHLIDLAIGNNRMLSALAVAEEVQQNLLPKVSPVVKGLDIAAKSIYCNKTGGDFYDFLRVSQTPAGILNVVIGDVSGHGIAAGLLMTTARALIRSRSAQPGTLSEIVTDVNRDLTMDIYDTGRFTTLLYLMVDTQNHLAKWVRAGHDAALLYDPASDRFEELYGSGLALGWDENYQYEENQRTDLTGGQLIFMGTDGIWETFDINNRPFGKKPLKDIIRRNAAASADEIKNKILDALANHRQGQEPEDDVTLIVIKMVDA
ncbi:MAG: serine/threonine-protein phosphatase [Deltaproteobacteria bacterium]|jgi:serine phosphatase RsbU (regulator of sigma subunit)|nr:serine/threonine-protein phosphatase [Deltaproteobacteria bacterium]